MPGCHKLLQLAQNFWEHIIGSMQDSIRMLQVTVVLTSGRGANLSLPESSNIGDLKALAKDCFERPFLRLVMAKARILTNAMVPVLAIGLQDGDQLTAVAGQVELAATEAAFVVLNSKLVTWGDRRYGGDSSAVQHQLRSVQCAAGSGYAECICCDPGRWLCCCLGPSTFWWCQF